MKYTDAEKMEVEGRCIADYIKRVMAEEPFLRDKNGLRKAEYSDFVIMMRSLGEKGAMLAGELRKNGIPVTFGKSLFLETVEISTFLSLLHIINNPDNDIALLSVMLSPIFGFTSDELARYRIDCRKSSLITAVHSAATAGDRHAISFLSRLDDFRREAAMLSLPKLMTKLLLMTDYLNIVAAMPEGKTRRANLQLLVQYAAAYHENSAGGIGGFLNYIASQPSETFASAKISGGENVVRIMTMHKSKGLQFPICILTHLGDSIHQKDTHDSVLYDESVGLGFRYFDENTSKKIKSIGFRTIGEGRRCERTEEELRVLYVAMTRAEERLAMFLPCNDLDEKTPAIATDLALNDGAISHRMLHGASSMGDWILTAAMRHQSATALREQTSLYIPELPTESKLDITIIDASKLDLSVTTTVVADEPKPIDPSLVAALKRNLAYSYPYDALRSIEAKSTVTVLANHAERDRFEFTAQPAFMLENGISAAKRGTATHHVMQFINFTDQPDVDAELERLVEWGFISEAETAAIDCEALCKFFSDPLYRRILNADEIHREMRFLTELPAGLVDEDLSSELQDEKIVVQGAVDLCIIENGEPTVIDFKTDRVTNPSELIDAYAEQLNIYSTACQKIFDRPVREKIIYSFELHKTIPLP
ncbi:MAG: PD-(D/E)XK nuclease family protein, partial [Clostridia bacterium]|nr:PD-(D/E)XK nuclease family protein [Clostridia bacterium]